MSSKYIRFLMVVACSGCFATKPDETKAECQSKENCRAGFACLDNHCAASCQTQGDCDADKVCFADYCVPRTAGSTPSIDTVVGNAQGMPAQIKDGFLVTGTKLATAEFELAGDGWAVPLTAKNRTDTAAEVVWSKESLASLPAGTNRGAYELVATNHSGSALTSVTLLLPDYTGDELVSRINTQATTTFTTSLMPSDILNRLATLEATVATLNGKVTALESALEFQTASSSNSIPGAYAVDLVPANPYLDLAAGTWLIWGHTTAGTSDVTDELRLGLYNDLVAATIDGSVGPAVSDIAVHSHVALFTAQTEVTLTAATTRIKLIAIRNGGSTIELNAGAIASVMKTDGLRISALRLK